MILSFLGAVHWGFALRPAGRPEAASARPRFMLGVLPALVGWVALLLPLPVGLALLAAGIAATLLLEERAARAGLMPWG